MRTVSITEVMIGALGILTVNHPGLHWMSTFLSS